MVINQTGRFKGEAFVQFNDINTATKGLDRHKLKIENRLVPLLQKQKTIYIYKKNIFVSTVQY
jgi:hypothetical protein